MVPILFTIFVYNIFRLKDPNPIPTPSRTPLPTSKSGVPSYKTVIITVTGAIFSIFLVVLILCVQKSEDSDKGLSHQVLLEKPEQ